MTITGYKENSCLIFERDSKKVMFDLKDGQCYNHQGRKVKSLNGFFAKISLNAIAENISPQPYQRFIKQIADGEEKCSNIGTFLNRLHRYAHLENYNLLGINTTSDIKNPTSFYPKDVLRYIASIKVVINKTWEDFFQIDFNLIVKIIRHLVDRYQNNFRGAEFIRYLTTWDFTRLQNLSTDCDYKTLIDYVIKTSDNEGLRVNQTIEFLDDYIRMQKVVRNGRRFDKYPKYLRSVHDIVAKNFNQVTESHKEEVFQSHVRLDLEYSGKYLVIAPKSTAEIKNEGISLRHCVASYIGRAVSGQLSILFLRTDPSESLVTLEIQHNALVQAKGDHNRSVSANERQFLKRYCKEKALLFQI